MQVKYSKAILIKKLRTLKKKLTTVPTKRECSFGWSVSKYFGGWNKGLLAAGYTRHPREKYTRETIKNKILDLKTKFKRNPTSRHNPNLAAAAQHYFGTWNNAICAAGLIPRIYIKYTKEIVKNKIRALSKRLNRPLTVYDNDALTGAARYYFGSWSGGLSAAGVGYTYRKNHRREILKNKLCVLAEKLKRTPRYYDDISLSRESYRYFGSWHNALRFAKVLTAGE